MCQDHPADRRDKKALLSQKVPILFQIIETTGPHHKCWMSPLAAARLIGTLFKAAFSHGVLTECESDPD